MLRAFGATDKGRFRLLNEDAFAIDEELRLCVIADGLGGHRAGSAIRQLTKDDSWTASVLAHEPHADRAALERHPMRHVLTNVVGTQPRTIVHVMEVPLRGGELLVLSTDGVHGVLDERTLE